MADDTESQVAPATEQLPSQAPAAEQEQRYCPVCGALREPAASTCGRCAARAERSRRLGTVQVQSIRSTLALYFCLLATSVAVPLGGAGREMDPTRALWSEWIVQGLHGLLVLAWVATSWRLLAPCLQRAGDARYYRVAAGGAVVTWLVATVVMLGLVRLLGVLEIGYVEPVFAAGHGWLAVILSVCVQPAVIEELAFRGVIFAGLSRVLSSGETVVVSALMFMVLHLAPLSFPHLLLIGLALGYLRAKSGSIYPGMLMHFLHNLACVLGEAWENGAI